MIFEIDQNYITSARRVKAGEVSDFGDSESKEARI
jgi:hypothetical protein